MAQSKDLRRWEEVIRSQFQRFFTCYAMSVNEEWGRTGNFFYRPYQRIAIQGENHLRWLLFYIHANPKRHGLEQDFTVYPWSSYPAFLSENPTSLEREAVLNWFGGKEGFIQFHRQANDWKQLQGVLLE